MVGSCDHDNKHLCFIKYREKLIDKNLNLCYITQLELSHYYEGQLISNAHSEIFC